MACGQGVPMNLDDPPKSARIIPPDSADVSELLQRVHARLGGLGVDITTYGSNSVEIRWRRDYGTEGLSDERFVITANLMDGLREILTYEDDADATDVGTS